jgi:hydroxymethylbilane synthase
VGPDRRTRRLRIGTRGSALARAQAGQVAALLRERVPGLEVELVVVAVSGDGGEGADKRRWVDAIEDGLRADAIDLAVHSAKDVPAELAPGLALLGAPPRADARDALCGAAGVAQIPAGARVGTGSVRRAAQLRALREDVEVAPLGGNVDTRLRRLREGAYDVVVLACAGLERLGRVAELGTALDPEVFVPSPGQGILALEARTGDERAAVAARAVSDATAMSALAAERAVVHALGAGCHTPVGAHAAPVGGDLELIAFVGLPDGSAWVRDRMAGTASDPRALGEEVAARLLAAGAGELLRRAEEPAVERA